MPREDSTQLLSERPLVLDLRTPQLMFDCGRHFQSIAYYAWRAGSPTIVRCSNLVLGGIARKVFGREMLTQPYVSRISSARPLPPGSLVLGDYEPSRGELQNDVRWRHHLPEDADRSRHRSIGSRHALSDASGHASLSGRHRFEQSAKTRFTPSVRFCLPAARKPATAMDGCSASSVC